MATPYDLYIRFLITRGTNDIKEMNCELENLHLPSISQETYDRQYSVIKSVVLYKDVLTQMETRVYNKDFIKWMHLLEVDGMWKGEPKFMEKARAKDICVVKSIHEDPYLRLTINALLLKGQRGRQITECVNPKFSCMLSEEQVSLYHKFFFDPQRMTRADWKVFLRGCSPKEKQIYFVAMSENLSILKTELELPSEINVSDAMQFLLSKSFVKAKEYLGHSTPEANKEARAWITQVNQLVDKYMKHRTSDTQDFAKTLQMEFDYIDNEFPTPDEDTLQQLQLEQETP